MTWRNRRDVQTAYGALISGAGFAAGVILVVAVFIGLAHMADWVVR